jgi:hypothetical protein
LILHLAAVLLEIVCTRRGAHDAEHLSGLLLGDLDRLRVFLGVEAHRGMPDF